MPTNSTDMDIRCKGCGRLLGDVTVRIPQGDDRTLSSVRWALGLIRCRDCHVARGNS